MGNGEVKELICMTHGRELRRGAGVVVGDAGEKRGCRVEGNKWGEKNRTTVIA